MALNQLLTKRVCICLADDNTGFVYRVKRFGLPGPRRFVATSSKIQIPAEAELPARRRVDARRQPNN